MKIRETQAVEKLPKLTVVDSPTSCPLKPRIVSGIWMFPKIGVVFTPPMNGENHGKPYFLMDDLGVPLFLETPI